MKVTSCLYCGDKNLSYVTSRLDGNGILRCARCGLMMVENLSDVTEELYTQEYFEKPKDTKHGYTNYLSSPVANLIGKYGFSRLFIKVPGQHLDLGCADGSLMEIFASEGFTPHGLEISKFAVEIAKSKGLDVRHSKLDTFPKDLPKMDVITAFDLLEHIDNPGVVLRDVFANLADNGYLVFSTLSVKKDDPTDYWYNNSLEHYTYYNQNNLTYILSEVFGKDNFAFTEMEVNGVAEFWGFAKKGDLISESEIVQRISDGDFNNVSAGDAFFVSLFYNQLSKFIDSDNLVKHFESHWSAGNYEQARFYNLYSQGRFEEAVNGSRGNNQHIPAASIYWQALSYAEDRLFEIRQEHITKEYNQEITNLRGQVFKLRDEIHTLRSSRVIGRVIKLRDTIGSTQRNLKNVPHNSRETIHKVRVAVGSRTPKPVRVVIKKSYRKTKSIIKGDRKQREIIYEESDNMKWGKDLPLVSIVMTYFNLGETIDETLNSLDSQTFNNLEIIIVDDKSTDPESIKKLEELRISGIKAKFIMHQKNQGPAIGRNDGIKLAKGKYIICLDSDDTLTPTFIEKSTIVLETNPEVSFITTHRQDFGVFDKTWHNAPYDALNLYKNNMIINAAEFSKEAWAASGGYKPGIGYEDWEHWLNLSEHGFWGKLIPEVLFRYRVSMQSRYVGDKEVHWNNLKKIHALHSQYKKLVNQQIAKRSQVTRLTKPETAFTNLSNKKDYAKPDNNNPNVLITVPWMTFGGAETLIYNYCREVKDSVNISFVTGLKSDNEWEYKFKEITPRVYHLANLFDDERLYVEFISNYIGSRSIDILHIIHNGFTFAMLPEIKKRHPKLKIVVTMFNDRAAHFGLSLPYNDYIDSYVSDNLSVINHYKQELGDKIDVNVIPNGINCYEEFSPALFDRNKERENLDLKEDDLAIFFVGRLSEEKNPDVFLEVARRLLATKSPRKYKFFMVGDGPMRPLVDKLIKSIHGDSVINLGYKGSADVARYLSAGDIFVLPSSIEGFPLTILEAMAMNLAVVASDVGAVSEVVDTGVNGYVVSAGSASEITKVITTLATNRQELDTVKIAARKLIENKYSNTILGNNYRNLYNKVARHESK